MDFLREVHPFSFSVLNTLAFPNHALSTGAPFLIDEGEVVAVDGRRENGGVGRGEITGDERFKFRVVPSEAEHDDLLLRDGGANGLNGLIVDGGRRLRPVEIVEVEDRQDMVVLCKSDLLVVEAPDETRRLDVALQFALDRQHQLREHAVNVRRMVLRFRPEYRGFVNESHLPGIPAFAGDAEVDVADDARTVVLGKVQRGDTVFQFFFTDK